MPEAGGKTAPWYGEGLFFSCLGCGRCCRGEPGAVWFTEEELHAMAEKVGLSPEQFRREYVWNRYGRPSLREKANYDCIFLDRNPDRCRIYDVRPAQCRDFPFWPDVLKSRAAWDAYAETCPGMNQGAFHPASAIARDAI